MLEAWKISPAGSSSPCPPPLPLHLSSRSTGRRFVLVVVVAAAAAVFLCCFLFLRFMLVAVIVVADVVARQSKGGQNATTGQGRPGRGLRFPSTTGSPD